MSLNTHFILIAHRGNSALAPENTWQAFDVALDQGFPHFETDCQLTADGVCVLVHDTVLGRTVQGEGAVACITLTQLQQLDAGSWFDPLFSHCRVSTLADTLERYRGRAHIHLELKSMQAGLPAAVAACLQASGWLKDIDTQSQTHTLPVLAQQNHTQPPLTQQTDTQPTLTEHIHSQPPLTQQDHTQPILSQNLSQVIPSINQPQPNMSETDLQTAITSHSQDIQHQQGMHSPEFAVPGLTVTSFHLEQLKASIKLLPGVRHGWLVQELTEAVLQEARACGIQQLCPRANACTREAVQTAQQQGFSIRAWGVKTLELLQHVADCRILAATVNWPHEGAQALQQRQTANSCP